MILSYGCAKQEPKVCNAGNSCDLPREYRVNSEVETVSPKETVVVEEYPPVYVEPERLEPDCSGLFEQVTIGTVGKRPIKRNGKFAAGESLGDTFVPLLYFNKKAHAIACADTLEVRVFRRGSWVRID